jgi:hypothetical protein
MMTALMWWVEPAGAIPLESWEDKFPNAGQRFKVLTEFTGAAVLDKETQLVWERSPDTTAQPWFDFSSSFARLFCANKTVGGRKGWRLPSFPELASLIDPANINPALPAGHPFTNVQSSPYWSATTFPDFPSIAWVVNFNNGDVTLGGTSNTAFVWCVRGGMNADQY